MYYIYIIRCTGDPLYTGITNDVHRRMSEHFSQNEKCAKFTRSHQAESLEALWSTADRSLASKLEYRIKQLTKPQKLRLIADNECFSSLFGSETASLYKREAIEQHSDCLQNRKL